MSVERERVAAPKPDVLSIGENDPPAHVEGFEEEKKTPEQSREIVAFGLLRLRIDLLGGVERHGADEYPHDSSGDEEDRRDDKGVVVAQPRNETESGDERASRARYFVEDLNDRAHGLQFLHVPTDDIPREDASNQLDHSVGNAGQTVDRNDPVRVVPAVVAEIVGMKRPKVRRLDPSTGRSIDNEKDGGEETEENNRGRENGSCRPTFDERSNEDGTNTLKGLVETREQADLLKCASCSATHEGILIVTIRGETDDCAVEGFQSELVQHQSKDVDDDISFLLEREQVPHSPDCAFGTTEMGSGGDGSAHVTEERLPARDRLGLSQLTDGGPASHDWLD